MEEIWKPVVGYEGLYEVSSLGSVRSCTRYTEQRSKSGSLYLHPYKGRLMKQTLNRGYWTVYLSKNKLNKFHSVHRLVASAFIPNPENLPQVNHKDENKQNNCVENLEWCTAKYNVNYGTGIERLKTAITGKPKHYSPESLQKFRESHRRENLSPETLKKMSNSQKGRTRSEEFKQYMREINTGERNPNYGRKHDEATRRKISEAVRRSYQKKSELNNLERKK